MTQRGTWLAWGRPPPSARSETAQGLQALAHAATERMQPSESLVKIKLRAVKVRTQSTKTIRAGCRSRGYQVSSEQITLPGAGAGTSGSGSDSDEASATGSGCSGCGASFDSDVSLSVRFKSQSPPHRHGGNTKTRIICRFLLLKIFPVTFDRCLIRKPTLVFASPQLCSHPAPPPQPRSRELLPVLCFLPWLCLSCGKSHPDPRRPLRVTAREFKEVFVQSM